MSPLANRTLTRALGTALFLTGLFGPAPLRAQSPVRVLTFDPTRSKTCGSLDFNFVSGGFHSVVRSNLLATANFGAGGTVGRPIQLQPQVCCLTPEALADADVVLISSLGKGLQSCELEAVGDFVQQGGGLFFFANAAASELGATFGASAVTASCAGGTATVVDPASPLVSGPFGVVSGPWTMACTARFTDVGPNGNVVLTIDAPICATFQVGSGRAVLFNDEEWCGNQSQAGCAVGSMPNVERERLFNNAVAWMIPPQGFQYVPGPACSGGTSYCTGAPNSVGAGATLSMTGSTSHAANDLVLVASGAVPGAFGVFFYGEAQSQVPFGDGFRCVESPLYLFMPGVQADASGTATYAVDFGIPPASSGPGAIAPCSTLYFQYWYRDPAAGGAGFNLSDGLEITVVP